MECSGAVYARIPPDGLPALESAVRQARRASRHASPLGVIAGQPDLHGFAMVDRWGKSDDMPLWSEGPDLAQAPELVALSRAVGEVVAFYEIDEGSTFGVYGAWRDGALVRGLVWGDDEWMRVQGDPQSWEAGLFAPEALARALEDAREDGREEAPIEAGFASGRVTSGASQPAPRAMARLIREALRAPAHGLQPWPRRTELVKRVREEDQAQG